MHELLRAVFTLGSASRQLRRRRRSDQISQISQSDSQSSRCLGPLSTYIPAMHFAYSCGTFCKSQCNQRQEQVGEDFSGNQPDQLTLCLHRASLNSTPQRESLSEEQHFQQSSKQQRRQPTSTTVAPLSQPTADQ
jgi:hypothetical protein